MSHTILRMIGFKRFIYLIIFNTLLYSSLTAAALLDFTLGTQIDPNGGQGLDAEATGATPKSTLAGLGLFVLNDASQVTPTPGAGNHHLVFSDTSKPDILIEQGDNADLANNSGNIISGGQGTSNGGAFLLKSITTAAMTCNIDFGSYSLGADNLLNTTDDSFDSNSNAVIAAGFTISKFQVSAGKKITVSFWSPNNTLLSTQTATYASGLNDWYFGFYDGVQLISRITISRETNWSGRLTYLIDLAFLPDVPNGIIFGLE